MMIELMCIMHEAEPYGYLLLQGLPPKLPTLLRLVNTHQNKLKFRLKELLVSGVLLKDKKGVIYSPRMVEDERKRQLKVKAGKRGTTKKPPTLPTTCPPPPDHEPHQLGDHVVPPETRDHIKNVYNAKADFRKVDHIEDVLNKISQRSGEHPSRGLHVELTKYIPIPIIDQALGDTQMATRDGDFDKEKERIRNPSSWFFRRVINLAEQQTKHTLNIEKWRKK